MTRTINVAVTGAAGRMGSLLVRVIHEARDMALVLALERAGHPSLGRDAGEAAGIGRIDVPIRPYTGADQLGGHVIVDFSTPEAAVEVLTGAVRRRIPIVIGTTGLTDAQKKTVARSSRAVPVVLSPNMSVGVNVMFRIASQTAAALRDGYDVEILEAHHRMKKDAPSGTALRLAEAVASALGRDLRKSAVYGRKGMIGERSPREIGIQVVRGGDIVGDHTVLFAGPGERLEITHRATSREAFARGALAAARWVVGRRPGLYDMADVLGLGPRP